MKHHKKVKLLLRASYKSNKKAHKLAKKIGFRLDHELSTKHAKVFYNKRGEPYVAFRGTKFSDLNDIRTDLGIFGGNFKQSERYKESKKLIKKIRKKYYNKHLTALGHSLGGKIAEEVGADKVITAEKFVAPDDIGRTLPATQYDIQNVADPVSLLHYFEKGGHTKRYMPQNLNVHGIKTAF